MSKSTMYEYAVMHSQMGQKMRCTVRWKERVIENKEKEGEGDVLFYVG